MMLPTAFDEVADTLAMHAVAYCPDRVLITQMAIDVSCAMGCTGIKLAAVILAAVVCRLVAMQAVHRMCELQANCVSPVALHRACHHFELELPKEGHQPQGPGLPAGAGTARRGRRSGSSWLRSDPGEGISPLREKKSCVPLDNSACSTGT